MQQASSSYTRPKLPGFNKFMNLTRGTYQDLVENNSVRLSNPIKIFDRGPVIMGVSFSVFSYGVGEFHHHWPEFKCSNLLLQT